MSMLLSFLGGAAEGVSSEIEKAEKSAKEDALLRVKGLTENYKETIKANRELQNNLNAEKDWIKSTYTDATPEQVAFLLGSPASLEALKKMKDPTKVSLSDVIAIKTNNESNAVASERITALPEVADAVGSKIKQAMPQYRSGLGGLFDRIGESAGDTAAKQYARATGVDLETLQSTKKLERPTQAGTFGMSKVIAASTGWSDTKDNAKLAAYQAQQEGDPAKIEVTKTALEQVLKADQGLTDPQKQFANDLAKAKSVLTNPVSTPAQVKEANAFYDRFLALEKREALAKKTGESKSESVPKLSALNSHASGSVATALTAQFGKAVSEQKITFSVSPQTGEMTPNILLTDPAERLKVATAARDAARASLDNYIDPRTNNPLTTDVATALNRYEYTLKIAQDEYNKSQLAKGTLKTDQSTQQKAAPTKAPAAIPSAQPTKSVSKAKVQEQAMANKVPYETAAAEARKQGYTIAE